jgi:osmotically-inducible protein OsmY
MTLPRRKAARRVLIFSGVAGVGLVAGVALADARDGPPKDDGQVALQARHSLWGESPFNTLNLGVTVRDGVACISGPVPSAAVGNQAVSKLRAVPGVRDVQNDTFVPSAEEPLARSMPQSAPDRRPSVSVGPAVAPPAPRVVAAPAPQRDPVVALSPRTAVPVKRMTIGDQVESLRIADRRFQNVRVEVRDGVVVLRGSVARSADAWEFAATIRDLPGVTNVVQAIETR